MDFRYGGQLSSGVGVCSILGQVFQNYKVNSHFLCWWTCVCLQAALLKHFMMDPCHQTNKSNKTRMSWVNRMHTVLSFEFKIFPQASDTKLSAGGSALVPGSQNSQELDLAGIRRWLRVSSQSYLANLPSCSWLVVRLEIKKLLCHMLSPL